MDLSGRNAIVVGAGRALGPQIVDALIGAKARVLVDSSPSGVGATREGATLVPLGTLGWDRFFDSCEASAGPVDILVHSPKIVEGKSALELSRSELTRVIEVELVDVLDCVQEAARRMAKRRKGRIITLVSMSGKTGVHKGVAAYAAAKGGVVAFCRSLAAEVAPLGVTVNCIATALFEPQVASATADHRLELTRGIPVGRFGQPVEAAHAVLYLAADEAAFVTGETLNLSGGRFMD